MADIFISYKKSDLDKVQPIVEILEQQGWTVWWDTRIDGGDRWDEVIERELAAARCILVVWTPDSIQSRWVRTEADEGLERNILVPLLLGTPRPPIAFKLIHSIDISGWQDDPTGTVIEKSIMAVRRTLDKQSSGDPRPLEPAMQSVASGNGEEVARLYVYWSDDKMKSLMPTMHRILGGNKFAAASKIVAKLKKQNSLSPGGPYIERDITMKWGVVDFGVQDSDFRVAVFYNEERRLLLCGSAKHVIGAGHTTYEYPARHFGFSGSNLPGIIQFVSGAIGAGRTHFPGSGDRTGGNIFLDKIAPFLVEQRLYFVARMLGQEFGLQIASPLFVALSEHPIETVPSALVVRHEEVDPDELKLQQENEERKRVLEERRRTFNELLDVGGIDAYKTALDIAGFSSKSVDNYSYERDIRHSQGFNFDGFLPDDQVLELAARNARASPFQLDLLMNKAYEREKIDVFLAIVREMLAINYYGPGVKTAVFVEDRLINVACPVLREFCEHSNPIARRAIGRAMDAIKLKDDQIRLSEKGDLASYEHAIKLWIAFKDRWGQRSIPLDKDILSPRLAPFLANPEVVARVARDVDGSPYYSHQVLEAVKMLNMPELVDLVRREK